MSNQPNTGMIPIFGSVVLYKSDTFWLAHCLEYDIIAQGATKEDAKKSFEKIFVGQIIIDLMHKKIPLADCEKAPKEIWNKIKQSNQSTKVESRPLYIPRERVSATIDEYSLAAAG